MLDLKPFNNFLVRRFTVDSAAPSVRETLLFPSPSRTPTTSSQFIIRTADSCVSASRIAIFSSGPGPKASKYIESFFNFCQTKPGSKAVIH